MKHNPFGDLRQRLGLGPADPADPAEPAAPVEPSGPITRAVVRYERSGRGGKDATIIEQLGLPPAELDVWLKALKALLGCGGSIEGAAIMLQGDHRTRLVQVLTARGVRKVIVG
jgi:translation initiation factor 1